MVQKLCFFAFSYSIYTSNIYRNVCHFLGLNSVARLKAAQPAYKQACLLVNESLHYLGIIDQNHLWEWSSIVENKFYCEKMFPFWKQGPNQYEKEFLL